MAIIKFYKKFEFYLNKHGLKKLISLALVTFWNTNINTKEIVFFTDLDTWNNDDRFTEGLTVESYGSMADVPSEDMYQLFRLKNREIIESFFNDFFGRGVTLWLAKIDKTVVGLRWTLIGGFNGFYSLPMSSRDAITLASEVFPEFRGRGISAGISRLVLLKLKEMNISRAYFKVHISNTSMLRVIPKMNYKRVGIVRTFSIFNWHITIWDKKSLIEENTH